VTVAFEPSKEAFHLVSALVERSMIVSFDDPVCLWCSIHRAISQWLVDRFLGAPVPLGCRLIDVLSRPRQSTADHVMLLPRGKKPIHHTRFRPTLHTVPISQARRQGTPFASVLGDKRMALMTARLQMRRFRR